MKYFSSWSDFFLFSTLLLLGRGLGSPSVWKLRIFTLKTLLKNYVKTFPKLHCKLFSRNILQVHTVLAFNKIFRQIKWSSALFGSKFTLEKCFFWEKLVVPIHSKHLAIHVYYAKFCEFSHEINSSRGKSRF